ncbi:MAG: phosphoribosylaminoimidazolesuccinocarboxamide synthase, partial [Abditibacteriota bacterium]|nr:phosphoribosylaminoimidazolesuccinocarboxamide synthase [Abditibacteriota bacterium]
MTVTECNIKGLRKHASGKVREIFDLGDSLLMVATDRISAFDVILPGGIENKGKVLTQISLFWFDMMRDIIPNHVITADTDEIIGRIAAAGAEDAEGCREMLDKRSIITAKARPLPVECIVRGYLSGSAWKEYRRLEPVNGAVTLFGISVPAGLEESERLPSPCFTPSTKAEEGHDINIDEAECCRIVGEETGKALRDKSIAIYSRARDYAAEKGVIICDTKFEYGFLGDRLIIIDEALTPDSSRFWDASLYRKGQSQPSYDKQYVRDYLETLDWNKEYPGPELPDEVREKASLKYEECSRILT